MVIVDTTKINRTKETAKQQLVKELFCKSTKPVETRKVIVSDVNECWGADLVFMPKKTWALNDDYKYILTIIDIFSRFAWCFPLKQKRDIDVINALETMRELPESMWVDEGGELSSEFLQDWLSSRDSHIYHTYGQHKSAVIERFNRTLKTKMFQEFELQDTEKWIDLLDEVVKDYNNTVHRSIGMTPNEARMNRNYKKVLKTFEEQSEDKNVKSKVSFSVGDRVRVRIMKETKGFSKGYTKSWSNDIYTIMRIKKTNPLMYKLQDADTAVGLKGALYHDDMKHTKF